MNALSLFDLKGKIAVITGGAMGLGKAMASALADAGATIVIGDLNNALAEKTVEEISGDGLALHLDVTKREQTLEFTEEVIKRFGHIDILINNAGICRHENAEDMSWDSWSKVMDVNLNGVFLMSQAVGNVMIKQQKGSIINIASMSGIIVNTPQPQSSYNASKAGVILLTKSLASEWAKYNIRVNAIAPGYMKTELTRPSFEDPGLSGKWLDMTPMGRPGEPWELGGTALYLASDASTFTTGSICVVDGGYTSW